MKNKIPKYKLFFTIILLLLPIEYFAFADTDWKSLNVPPLIEDGSYRNANTVAQDKQASMLQHKLRLHYDVGADAIEESLKWQNGESPKPVLKADGVVRFPYGEYQPVVTCKPLNLCDIELQAGEDIQGILIGDSVRWNDGDQAIPVVYSGAANKLTPHLVLKPSQSGLDTTLMVTTSKRTYMIKLRSSSDGYVQRAGFYYPHESLTSYNLSKEQLKKNALEKSNNPANSALEKSLLNISKLNYKYSINGNYSFKPKRVFDDGISVFIEMPANIDAKDLPGLCVLADYSDSECELVNFRYNEHFYIIDKLFDRAKLVNGFGKNQQVVMIMHNLDGDNTIRPKQRFWTKVFGEGV